MIRKQGEKGQCTSDCQLSPWGAPDLTGSRYLWGDADNQKPEILGSVLTVADIQAHLEVRWKSGN